MICYQYNNIMDIKETPKYLHNYERFDTAKEAIKEFKKENLVYKNDIEFLDWLAMKIENPDCMKEPASEKQKQMWEQVWKQYNTIKQIKNIDAFQWTWDLTGKMIYDLWMKYEVNNPPGSSIAGKRWIVDWLFDPINADLHKVVS